MEDKVFGLLEKMYVEMKEMKSNMATKKDLDNTRQDLARLEDKMDNHFKALYDGYKQNTEKLCEVEVKVNDLNNKVEGQEVEVRVIKGGK